MFTPMNLLIFAGSLCLHNGMILLLIIFVVLNKNAKLVFVCVV